MKRGRRAFTFIEVLMVITLVAVVGTACFALFNNGLKVWARMDNFNNEQTVRFFLAELNTDVRNLFPLKQIVFRGDAKKVTFACFSREIVKADSSQTTIEDQIQEVSYVFDAFEKTMTRTKRSYRDIMTSGQGTKKIVARNIERCVFEYRVYNPSQQVNMFAAQLDHTFPVALRLTLEFKDGARTQTVVRTIEIPSVTESIL